jgi:hypothetical protein
MPGTPRIWPICCGWDACPRHTWPRRRCGSCTSWSRHRAKLVGLRSGLKASVHAVLAKQGMHIAVSDLFGVGGRQLLAAAALDGAYRGRVDSLCRLIDAVDFEIDAVAGPLRARLAGHRGYTAADHHAPERAGRMDDRQPNHRPALRHHARNLVTNDPQHPKPVSAELSILARTAPASRPTPLRGGLRPALTPTPHTRLPNPAPEPAETTPTHSQAGLDAHAGIA